MSGPLGGDFFWLTLYSRSLHFICPHEPRLCQHYTMTCQMICNVKFIRQKRSTEWEKDWRPVALSQLIGSVIDSRLLRRQFLQLAITNTQLVLSLLQPQCHARQFLRLRRARLTGNRVVHVGSREVEFTDNGRFGDLLPALRTCHTLCEPRRETVGVEQVTASQRWYVPRGVEQLRTNGAYGAPHCRLRTTHLSTAKTWIARSGLLVTGWLKVKERYKGVYSSLWGSTTRAAGCHLPKGLTQ